MGFYDKYDICIGDECMGLYKNGILAIAATRLTFADVLEACGISVDLWEADQERYNDPTKMPRLLKEVVMDGEAEEV